MSIFEVRTHRKVPLEELAIEEATVLPAYFIEAENRGDALEDFYWNVPIANHDHFDISADEVLL